MCEGLTVAIIHIHSITKVQLLFEAETVPPTYMVSEPRKAHYKYRHSSLNDGDRLREMRR